MTVSHTHTHTSSIVLLTSKVWPRVIHKILSIIPFRLGIIYNILKMLTWNAPIHLYPFTHNDLAVTRYGEIGFPPLRQKINGPQLLKLRSFSLKLKSFLKKLKESHLFFYGFPKPWSWTCHVVVQIFAAIGASPSLFSS